MEVGCDSHAKHCTRLDRWRVYMGEGFDNPCLCRVKIVDVGQCQRTQYVTLYGRTGVRDHFFQFFFLFGRELRCSPKDVEEVVLCFIVVFVGTMKQGNETFALPIVPVFFCRLGIDVVENRLVILPAQVLQHAENLLQKPLLQRLACRVFHTLDHVVEQTVVIV